MTSEQNAPGDFENIENGKKLPGIHHNDAFEVSRKFKLAHAS